MTSTPITIDRSGVRVGIIDDHALVSETLAVVLGEQGFEAHGLRPQRLDEVMAFVTQHDVNVVLLDLNFGELGTSLPVIPELRELGCQVVMLTGETSRASWGECIEAGAACVVSKAVSFGELLQRVTMLLDDVVEKANAERYELLDALRSYREQERRRLEPFERLTVREHEVLQALTEGKSAEEISASMFVSMATVRSHIRAILQKLGVNSQLAAVALATRAGWSAEA